VLFQPSGKTKDGAVRRLLSQFASVTSGFDLGDGLDLQSLGFGSSPSAMSGMQLTSGSADAASAEGGGHIFSLALLGQYAANFSGGVVGHDGPVITDPSVTTASGSLPLVAPSHD